MFEKFEDLWLATPYDEVAILSVVDSRFDAQNVSDKVDDPLSHCNIFPAN